MLPAEIAKALKVNNLLDVYGLMLTSRQREVVQLYYRDDFSLAEIAADTGTSRQAVHDLLQRGVRALEDLETRLRFCYRSRLRRNRLEQALSFLRKGQLGQVEQVLCQLRDEEIV